MLAPSDALISLDADLQDDIGALRGMLDAYAAGNEIVYGVRSDRSSDTRFKRITARAHYRLLSWLGVDTVPDQKLLHHTRQELPHATAVFVERWTESEPGAVKIEATILVERPSQRAIVLGKGGSKIKTIGTEARLEVERLLDVCCTLLLHVEVRKDWRNEPRTLADLGLE